MNKKETEIQKNPLTIEDLKEVCLTAEDLKEVCLLIGCSGINSDCPGNPKCQILKKVIFEESNYGR